MTPSSRDRFVFWECSTICCGYFQQAVRPANDRRGPQGHIARFMPLDLLEIPGSPASWAGAATQNLGDLAVSYDGKGALPCVGGSPQGSVATAKRQRLPNAACELAPARARRNFRVGIRYGGHPSFSMPLSGRYNMQKISAA
jgi:hypothetical protein